MAAITTTCRVQAHIGGTVQGVGFRPFVFRLAEELALAGWVRNDERGVELEVEGARAAVEEFLRRLPVEAPPLARVEHIRSRWIAARGERGFLIAASATMGAASAPVTADAATCRECLAELLDPDDRRFRYPFINCTNCGPRFTIVRAVPYDRPSTTMAGFTMCEACRAEYEDPRDRRFHAQPNACPACGPRVRLVSADLAESDAARDRLAPRTPLVGRDRSAAEDPPADGDPFPPVDRGRFAGVEPLAPLDPVAAAAQLIAGGAIVAIKGLGGHHLACLADEHVVARLRARKRREERPFALMVADLEAARRLVELEETEEGMLCESARPIVLARRLPGAPVAPSLAPGVGGLGLMLPYTPIHHLLLGDLRALGVDAIVMTSGNISDEPIAYRDEDAVGRLVGIADAFLLHDRPIHIRTDDSVVRTVRTGGPSPRRMTVRRSRGYVPASLPLPVHAAPLLACGAELKSTFCLARAERAWVSHHIGDLRNWETLRSFREGVAHFEALFALAPELIVHDLHPDYLSTAYALGREGEVVGGRGGDGVRLLAVQHHHAHLAAVLAEHGRTGPAVGAIFDGAGLGEDGTVWGGELLVGGLAGFRRAGHLHSIPLPGGDVAVRQPWRMACTWLAATTGRRIPAIPPALAGRVQPARWEAVARVAASGLAPTTTSAGRLCDAVAALCGVRAEVTYEGQAAIELEAIADPDEQGSYELTWRPGKQGARVPDQAGLSTGKPGSKPPGRLDRGGTGKPGLSGAGVLDPAPAVASAVADLARGAPVSLVSARFHNGFASAAVRACVQISEAEGISLVVLAGGVFQNRLLLERMVTELERAGIEVLIPERLPPNDGAIAFGQAAIAASVWQRRRR